MKIQLSDHFNYKRLLQFVLPSTVMMIFTSIYGVVDGLFVSNFAGKTQFAAVNLIMPFLMILGAIGFMIGTGGSAIVSKTLGEGKKQEANQYFSMLVYVTIISGIVLAVAGISFIRPISVLFGADEVMAEYCVLYGRIILLALPAFMLQNIFQSFLITAEKPALGLIITFAAGVTNIILDYLFIVFFNLDIAGAAVATAISQVVGGIAPFIYFLHKNKSLLQLTKAKFNSKILIKACTNGSSEFLTNISMSVVNILYNWQLMQLAGENGIAAYGVIMYVGFIFAAIFIGYSIGTAPIIGYNYGAANHSELKNLFKKSRIVIGITGIALTFIAITLSTPLSSLFVGYDAELFEMTKHGFTLYSLSFLILGFNIFGSAFFTALNNGIISAVISFLRTLIFQIIVVLTLPLILGIDGIWLSVVMSEILSLIVTFIFFITQKKHYHYA